MKYFTFTTKYEPVASKMAELIEDKINKELLLGHEFISFSITSSCKAILVFKINE